MKVPKKYRIQDLNEQIERVDKMIALHSTNSSTIMLNQYKFTKEKLQKELEEIKAE